jgi:hypothetical protein
MFELARDGRSSGALQGNRDMIGNSVQKTPELQQPQDFAGRGSYYGSKLGVVNQDTKYASEEHNPYRLILHTHTPVRSVKHSEKPGRRWALETDRGIVQTDTVIYATNAYISHLLPHLSGPSGIIPVRGQVVAIRARVGYSDEGWKEKDGVIGLTRSGWRANEGYEYWFPRPHPRHRSYTSLPSEEGISATNTNPNERIQNPLIILGGGRDILKDKGMCETDDSKLDAEVSTILRRFLHNIFPGQYSAGTLETVSDNIEVEWVMSLGHNFP